MAEGNGDLATDDGQLKTLIAEVDATSADLQQRVTSLNNILSQVQGGWSGEASTAYQTLQQNANTYLQKLQKRMRLMHEALESAKGGFDAEELKQLDDYKRITAASPINNF